MCPKYRRKQRFAGLLAGNVLFSILKKYRAKGRACFPAAHFCCNKLKSALWCDGKSHLRRGGEADSLSEMLQNKHYWLSRVTVLLWFLGGVHPISVNENFVLGADNYLRIGSEQISY